MPKITFLSVNQEIQAEEGETILDAAIRCDVPLQHACGGFCACTTCHVRVVAGATALSPMAEDEKDRLEQTGEMTASSRLGCQTKVFGDVTLEMIHLD